MIINRNEYLDKVKGCFIAKNIGGTLGAPYEGTRKLLNIKGFKSKKGNPLPNDDLDIQLVWLVALENEGPRHINSNILSNYWQSYIIPYWNEYGISKNNNMLGVFAGCTGDLKNNENWKHSNGAWIRTEIWVCLAPGDPDLAIRYAIEDARIDHGNGEGTYAAMFIAAIESMAFIINDIKTLINNALNKIPASSRIAKTIKLILKLYNENKDFVTIRNEILKLNQDIGDGWFEAPTNIGFVIIGLLFGNLDFEKSILTAINCGDDTDCTGATVASILGIILGTKNIPNKLKNYIGKNIITFCINPTLSFKAFDNINNLVERINKQVDYFLYSTHSYVSIGEKTQYSKKDLNSYTTSFAKNDERIFMRTTKFSLQPNTLCENLGPISVLVSYVNGVELTKLNEEKIIKVQLFTNYDYGNISYEIKTDIILPQEFKGTSLLHKTIFSPQWSTLTKLGCSKETYFSFIYKKSLDKKIEVLLKITLNGKSYYIPLVFIPR